MSASETSRRTTVAGAKASTRAAFAVMCVGYFLVLLDVTIVNVALPTIGKGLGAGVSALQWVVGGYAVALASLMLGGGTVGDIYGHKRVVLLGFALFGVASLGCALAPSSEVLVAFRALQGAGAALMLPGTLAVIANLNRGERERARAIGAWAAIGSLALPAGPLLGGALIEAVGWRALFFMNLPLVALAIAVAAKTVHEPPSRARRSLDFPGIGLGGSVLVLVTFAFIEGGRSGASVAVIAAGIAALLLGAAFILWERGREDAMLPLGLFRRARFSAANGVAATMNLATLGLLFLVTLYLQDVRHRSPLAAGLELLPLFLPLSLIAPVGGRLTVRMGPRITMAIGLVLSAAGAALLTRLAVASNYAELLPALLAWGIGLALLTPAVVATAVAAVPDDRSGLASAVNNTARQAGGAVGIAAFGALAGSPRGESFLGGFHLAAAITAGLFALGALLTARFIPSSL